MKLWLADLWERLRALTERNERLIDLGNRFLKPGLCGVAGICHRKDRPETAMGKSSHVNRM
jgi:hypothetical protein